MAQLMSNCNYNKVALLHDVVKLHWRIQQYLKDADKDNHPLCKAVCIELQKELEKTAGKLKAAVSGICKEGKL